MEHKINTGFVVTCSIENGWIAGKINSAWNFMSSSQCTASQDVAGIQYLKRKIVVRYKR